MVCALYTQLLNDKLHGSLEEGASIDTTSISLLLIVVGSRVAIGARVLQAVRDVLQDVAVWYASLRGLQVKLTSFEVRSRKRCAGEVRCKNNGM